MTGFINVWKAEGDTSAFAVNRVKHLIKCPCGHMGTLDPLASGVLPIGVGNAARLFDYFLTKKKVYLAKFQFGVTSKTLDRESEPVYGGNIPDKEEIERALKGFLGDIEQTPPAFSAKSVNGKRSYEIARMGHEVILEPKTVHIDEFRLLEQTGENEFSFEISCGGGTYIRSLARDLAIALGTNGYMTSLERVQSGAFQKQNSVPLRTLTKENILQYLIPTDSVLPFPSLTITDERLYHGLPVECEKEDGTYKLYNENGFYGVARVQGGFVKTEKKLC